LLFQSHHGRYVSDALATGSTSLGLNRTQNTQRLLAYWEESIIRKKLSGPGAELRK